MTSHTQLNLLHAGVHGNKARKLLSLARHGLEGRLPPLIVSHGGVQVRRALQTTSYVLAWVRISVPRVYACVQSKASSSSNVNRPLYDACTTEQRPRRARRPRGALDRTLPLHALHVLLQAHPVLAAAPAPGDLCAGGGDGREGVPSLVFTHEPTMRVESDPNMQLHNGHNPADHAQFCELPAATYASVFGGDDDDEEEGLAPPDQVMRRLQSEGLLAEEEEEEEDTLFIPQVCVPHTDTHTQTGGPVVPINTCTLAHNARERRAGPSRGPA